MLQLVFTNKFKKDVKLLQQRGFNMDLLKNVFNILEIQGNCPLKTDHINYQVIILVFGRLMSNRIG